MPVVGRVMIAAIFVTSAEVTSAEIFITRNPDKLRHVAKLVEPLSRLH